MIDDKFLRMVAEGLDYAARNYPPNGMVLSTIIVKLNLQPPFQKVYETLMGLPESHPLKIQYSPDILKKGYERLSIFGITDTSEPCFKVCLRLQPWE